MCSDSSADVPDSIHVEPRQAPPEESQPVLHDSRRMTNPQLSEEYEAACGPDLHQYCASYYERTIAAVSYFHYHLQQTKSRNDCAVDCSSTIERGPKDRDQHRSESHPEKPDLPHRYTPAARTSVRRDLFPTDEIVARMLAPGPRSKWIVH